jgi:crossover junction endodeoxyribonuclease RusA
VARAARSRWPTGQLPWSTALRVSISEFGEFLERPRRDRDNTAKPILDALQGLIYLNDGQILELEVDALDINGRYLVRYISPVVAAALTRGDEFVWVRVFLQSPAKDLSR